MPMKDLAPKNQDQLNRLENKILQAFDEAKDVDDTIWYSDHVTLYDKICRILKDELCRAEGDQ